MNKGHVYLLVLLAGLLSSAAMGFYAKEIADFFNIGRSGIPFLEAIGFVLLYSGLLLSCNHYLQKIRFFNLESLLQNVLIFALFILLLYQVPLLLEHIEKYNWILDNPIFTHLKPFLLILYSVYAFSMFGRLAFVQKPKTEVNIWRAFLALLILSVFIFFIPFSLPLWAYYAFSGVIAVFILYFSFGYKWISLMNIAEMKYTLVLLIPINLIHILLWLGYYYQSDLTFMESMFHPNLFYYNVITFVIIYGMFSMLALIFHLPMQSLEEKREKDIKNIFAIQELILKRPGVENIFNYLFDTSVETAKVEAGWIRYKVKDEFKIKTRNININLIEKIESILENEKTIKNANSWVILNPQENAEFRKANLPYHSISYFSLVTQDEKVMELILADTEEGKFDQYVFRMLQTYYNQTKLAYDNKLLLEERLSSEVMKNEMEVAKDIQMSMIPVDPPQTDYCDIFAITRPAKEVGGDFYDYFLQKNNGLFLLIGDVTGKGLPAAIHMAEVKGIIQALIQFDLPLDEFAEHLNKAVSDCFQKNMFLTINLVKIDPVMRKISYIRAGHCPMLYYHKTAETTEYFEEKGMGVGIIRNEGYKKYVSVFEKHYDSGDVFILFTDGYIETTNPLTGEEFGYERMELSLKNADKSSPEKVVQHINKNIKNYAGSEDIDDDLLILAGKFK